MWRIMNRIRNRRSTVVPLQDPPPAPAPAPAPPPPPPIEGEGGGGGANSSSVEESIFRWLSRTQSLSAKPGLMFTTKLDSEGSDPERDQTTVLVFSDEMREALSRSQEGYVKVLARNYVNTKMYELHFSRGNVNGVEEFILRNQWGQIVTDIALKEGDSVSGYGFDERIEGYFRVLLRFAQGAPWPPENQDPQAKAAELEAADPWMIFLFEKKMGVTDLNMPAIERCSNKMKMSLRKTLWRIYIRVFVKDPNGNLKEIDMSFSRDGLDCYSFFNGWDDVVAAFGVEEGDLVTGIGQVFDYHIGMLLHILKENVAEEETNVLNRIGNAAILLFEKELEPVDTEGLLVRFDVLSCKDVVKAALGEMLEAEGNIHAGYVRVSAADEEGRWYDLRLSRGEGAAAYVVGHEWRAVVTNNGLKSGDKVWCWGRFREDGSIKMMITVDVKALAAATATR